MSEFIKITKNGETIEVHPDALEEHVKRLGWTVVIEPAHAPVAAETPAPKPPAKKAAK